MAMARRQVISWTNADPVHWRVYTSPDFNELTPQPPVPLQWRHNEPVCVSNHQPHDCLLNRLFRRRSKETSKRRVTGLCARNSPGTGEFPAPKASNAENVSIWWRHHGSHTQGCDVTIATLPVPLRYRYEKRPSVVVIVNSVSLFGNQDLFRLRAGVYVTSISFWRHGVSNYRHFDWLFNSLVISTAKETPTLQ